MKLEINKIYKVKERREGKCSLFKRFGSFIEIKKIEIEGIFYDILDSDKNYVGQCEICFTEDDLEPLEEENNVMEIDNIKFKRGDLVEVRELNCLVEGDEIIDDDEKIYKVLDIDISYKILGDKEKVSMWRSVEELRNQGYSVAPKKKKQLTKKEIANKFNLNEDEIEII